MRRVGLYFGSFNPVHNGHLMLAQWILNNGYVDEVWFVVSPQNPFKENKELLPSELRLEMLRLSVEKDQRMRACDIELSLPTPSYTINTLRALYSRYPNISFSMIMGADNVPGLHKWREAEAIFNMCEILVYPRDNMPIPNVDGAIIHLMDSAPQFDVSSTLLRQWLREGKSICHYTPSCVTELMQNKL
ncbi:MAG: nicotinate (nicotinamide) nucleotide adenylyltransferase [Bacteroidia bacterium]|nr:nicotinate (nicotinamide) nucleotide adenylyltransferase [Bacteroidia bacterium]